MSSTDFQFGVPAAVTVLPPPTGTVPPPQGTGVYEHNPNHVAQAQANLIDFFRKPRNKEAVGIIAAQIQEIEDLYYALINAFDLDTATGNQLDMIGARVGQLRNDRTDDEYRVAINVRILVNTSHGSLPELLTILETAVPGIDANAREEYPAGLLFRFFDVLGPPKDAAELIVLIRQAKPAGVRIHGIFGDSTLGFRWSTVANSGQPTNRAFATVSPGGDGGLLQRVLA